MSPFDLTNLAALKAWLGLPSAPGPSDATLSALVTAASRSIYAALSRPSLLPFSYAETIDLETSRVTLRHWPVLQVTSVTWRGIAVPLTRMPTWRRQSVMLLSPAMGFRRAGRRRSIYSAISTDRDGKVSSYPTAPVMQFKTRRKPFPPPLPSSSPRFRLMDPGDQISA